MGSQILEILRQGIWASLTGGWFYDPHQDVFCNTFHLYIWLFLLCFPFTIYLYFPFTLSIWSLYCGSVAVLFTLIKFANHHLHQMFDTSECIRETVAEDDLPESEKKRAQIAGTKHIREEEGIEMQVFVGSKRSSLVLRPDSFNEQSDRESVESFELAARAVSSTIDLKVDVHRKNSSESSEENCIKKNDLDKNTKEDRDNNLILQNSSLEFHTDVRLKSDVIQDGDFELSQSDCHIAKLRQDNKDIITDTQISHSDNHIANIRQTTQKNKDNQDTCVDIDVRDDRSKRRNGTFYRNICQDTQTDKTLQSNTSCSVLTLNPNVKKQILKNTGSLELPLKDDALSPLEKGMLYWKQHNLESNTVDEIKIDDSSLLKPTCDELHIRSETNINKVDNKLIKILSTPLNESDSHGDNRKYNADSDKTLKFSKTEGNLNKLPPYCIYNNEHIVSTSNLSEELGLKLSEDWNLEQNQRTKQDKTLFKYSSDEDKFKKLKFQPDSDDSSEDCGSRSPLLCRHQSLEKEPTVKDDKCYVGSDKNVGRISRTMSVDEKTVCDNTNWKKKGKCETYHHVNKKLSVTLPIDLDDVVKNDAKNDDIISSSNDRVGLDWLFEHTDSETDNHANVYYCDGFNKTNNAGNNDKLNVTQDETLPGAVLCLASVSNRSNGSLVFQRQNQGAIPKQRINNNGNRKEERRKRSRDRVKYYSDDAINVRDKVQEKIRNNNCEREGNIIDEEDVTFTQDTNTIRTKETTEDKKDNAAGSSNSSSTTEISTLLPTVDETKKLNRQYQTTRKLEELPLSPVAEDNTNKKTKEGSSGGDYNTLLPPPSSQLLATFLATRKELPAASVSPVIDGCGANDDEGSVVLRNNSEVSQVIPNVRTRNRKNRRTSTNQRSSRSTRVSSLPLVALTSILSTSNGTHIATSHEDTTQGAIHCFQDERGNWLSYTFDAEGTGTVNQLPIPIPQSTTSKSVQAQYYTKVRERDVLVNLRAVERPTRHHNRRNINVNKTQTDQKSGDTWDSNINLMSNSNTNSENESSVSLSSSNISPNSEITYLRPRGQRKSHNASGIVATTSNTSNDNNNNNNNNSENWLLETMLGPASTSRSPFYILTENRLERHRQRSVLHSPSIMPDLSTSLNTQPSLHSDLDLLQRNRGRLLDPIDTPTGEELKKVKHYYKLFYTPWNFIKIRFDRLDLIALFDRNLTYFETLLSLLLAVLVSLCGVILLNYGLFYDIFAFLFCFTMAGCQYCLVKSVQPDSSSPTHGYNRYVVFSRPIYFCLACIIIILLTTHLDSIQADDTQSIYFYNINVYNKELLVCVRDGLCNFLLFFPLLFSLGLFPQINTFMLYLLEQIDMHVFGGNAMSNLIGGFYCLLKSTATVLLLYGFVFGALSEVKSSQHILFSIYCSLLISSGYHLSRCSSDPTIMWNIIKHYLIQDENEENYINNKIKNKKHKYNSDYLDKSVDESNKSEKIRNEDKLSIDKNSQNNLLLNSNPSSNETLGTHNLSGSLSKNSGVSNERKDDDGNCGDPLPMKLKQTVHSRLKNDVIVCTFIGVLVFGIHSSTIFTVLQPDLNPIIWGIAGSLGFLLHYIVPQLRKQLPWLCISRPVFRSHEHGQIEVRDAAKVMWFEKVYIILCFVEKNLIYPILLLATVTYDSPRISRKFGVYVGSLLITICSLKLIRSSFSNTPQQYLIVIFTTLLFQFDYQQFTETFLIDYFFISILYHKVYEFLLKLKFVVTYIAPWQITWGSAFHAFAQPFSVPHSAMLFVQALLSALLSSPLNPFLGSAIFLTSYVRPIKFWERDYNTKRVDHSNTRLSSHLERNLGSDDNNLNSIFYEHLTRSLQHSLCGDLTLGRWGHVNQGDCFVLASDYLNCLVHIIEMGNGLVTFQMRGLEFRGTYCQQREVEAISEGVEDNGGCCCCEPGHLPHMLSVDAAFSQRWLAWEVTATKYVLEGYSISDNSAGSMLQVFDFRKVLVTYYVKSIIFYCIRSPKLEEWLTSPAIVEALQVVSEKNFVDLDPIFNVNIDLDYDFRAEGVTRNSFCNVYLEWMQFCANKRDTGVSDKSRDSPLVSLCLALSLMGRRTLGAVSQNTVSNVEYFLYGLHALFKGDFRITSVRDEWIFSDMELLKKVVAPAVRMSLKLHQDHFSCPEEYEDPNALYEAISSHDEKLVISHEGDPAWRTAVLSGTPSLLALRHVMEDGTDEYKIIMLNKRYLSFRVIKLNRECVRGLWAGQQQELVFLRNRNPERGSIQNAKQALRNMINSSCDQPIGYPIYVSPLTTSYADTNTQLTSIVGGSLSLQGMKNGVLKLWRRIRARCREGCSSGSAANPDEGHDGVYAMTNLNVHSGYGHNTSGSQSMDSSQIQLGGSGRGGSLGRSSLPSVSKPGSATLVSLAGLLSSADIAKGDSFLRERETSFTFTKERPSRESGGGGGGVERRREMKETKKDRDRRSEYEEPVYQRVKIVDPNQVYDAINLGRRIDVHWPDEGMRARGGRSFWKDWIPDTGMEGQVVHRWVPNHRDVSRRSHVDKTILLVKIDDRFVPIAECAVQDLGAEV